MAKINLLDRISQGLFFLDGAMGTQLFARDVQVGRCNDYLNIESPDIVAEIHLAYFNAGSDAVLTNTFGANAISLGRYGLADEVENINLAAAQIARKAAPDDKYVLGDIGPCGEFLAPLGTIEPDKLKTAFADQAKALAAGGVDGFMIETMTALDEITIAVEAVKSVSDLPVFVSLAFDPAGDKFKTMMGAGVAEAVAKLAPLKINAIGFNCGTLDMGQYEALTADFITAIADKPIAILAKPNAGRPELVDGKAVYSLSPVDFADAACRIHTAGAKIIGGCCGTSPEHIRAMTQRLTE